MKNLLLILSFFIVNACYGQSSIESISKSGGTITEWEVLEKIENLAGCGIEVIKIKDVISGKEKTGLSISKKYRAGNDRYRITQLLDADEVDALTKAIPIILERASGRPKGNYKEVFYRSRGGLFCGCIKEDNAWIVMIKVNENNPNSYAYMQRHDMDMFLDFLKQAKPKLSK